MCDTAPQVSWSIHRLSECRNYVNGTMATPPTRHADLGVVIGEYCALTGKWESTYQGVGWTRNFRVWIGCCSAEGFSLRGQCVQRSQVNSSSTSTESPGSRISIDTLGAISAACSANSRGGLLKNLGLNQSITTGQYVPQWTGIAATGFRCSSD
jgi:hypothetical protein